MDTAILFISVRSLKKPCGVRLSRTVIVKLFSVTSVTKTLLKHLLCFCQNSGGGTYDVEIELLFLLFPLIRSVGS